MRSRDGLVELDALRSLVLGQDCPPNIDCLEQDVRRAFLIPALHLKVTEEVVVPRSGSESLR